MKLSSVLSNVSRETYKMLIFCSILGIFFISGCGEDSVIEDITAFNKIIENNKEIKSAKEVMVMYYNNYLYTEPGGKYTITEEQLPRNRFMVVLIRDNIGDDSMQGEKFVMIVKHEENKWKVVTINRNWKCYPGRGHTDWGTGPCG